jgi:glycosyltransferase involved in cell wall biosynthesis
MTELAAVLGERYEVRLAAPAGSEGVAEYDPRRAASLARCMQGVDVMVAPPLAPAMLAGRRRPPWVCDLYNPELFEGLEVHAERSPRRRRALDVVRIDRLAYAARTADGFVCASERQRDMWLGFLGASRRVRSADHARDRDLRELIDVVAAGVPDAPATRSGRPPLRGSALPGDARIVLWNGGLWPWLDPELVARAVAALRRGDPRWVLVVSGSARPRGATGPDATRALQAHLPDGGLHVAADWTPYAERADLLLEADVGVCTHRRGVEARFADRTRLLDCVWAGLPIVCTAGDAMSDVVAARGLGRVVPAGDEAALAAALAEVAQRGRAAYADALAALAAERRWSVVSAPLVAAIERVAARPARRPDLVARLVGARHETARRIAGR